MKAIKTTLASVFIALALNSQSLAQFSLPGELDTTFNTGTGADNIVWSVTVQPDGKVLLGGFFTIYNGISRNRIARLNLNGSLDTTFNPSIGANNIVRSVVLQPDGKILIGGQFTSYNSIPRNYIARLNADGSLDPTFNPGTGANNLVLTLALQPDGKVIIGGLFTSYNGTSRNRIARLHANGSLDTTFNPGTGANNNVWCLALKPDGKIFVGGFFDSFNDVSRFRIARLNSDGSLDTTFNFPANNVVLSITLQSDGKVLIGGAFGNYLARLNANGSPDFTFNTGIGANLNVNSLPLQPDGKVLIGGDFTAFNGSTHNYINRLNSDGSLDTSFNAGSGANAVVYSIALQPDGKALIGGNFTTYNGTFVNRIARIYAYQPCIPATPAAQPVSGIGNNTATLNWSTCNATGVTGYQVWVSGGIGVLNVGNVQSFSLNSLAAGTQYSWSVRALSGPTSSAWIPGVPFTTTGVQPCLSLPSGLFVSNVSNTSATLGWASQTGISKYQMWISGFPVTTVIGNSFIATGLVSGTVYDWAVRALCPSGILSNWASGQFTTTGAAACAAPTGLNATFVFPQSNFSWDAVAVPNVQYQIWIQGVGVFPSLISTNSFSTTTIPLGQTRSWSVRTLCPGGVITSWSSSVFTAARGSMAAGREEIISVEEMIAADKMLAAQLEGKPVVYPNPSLDRFMVVSYLESRFSILTLQGTTLVEGVLQEGTTEVIWPEGATEGVYLFQVQTERGAVREKLIRRR